MYRGGSPFAISSRLLKLTDCETVELDMHVKEKYLVTGEEQPSDMTAKLTIDGEAVHQ